MAMGENIPVGRVTGGGAIYTEPPLFLPQGSNVALAGQVTMELTEVDMMKAVRH